MALELKRLIEKVSHMNLSVVAGKNNLDNIVYWIQMVEEAETTRYLISNELAVTTGIGLKTDDELYALIKNLYLQNAAGIIVNIGPYIPKIPQNVIDFCNNAGFPLLTIPWAVSLSEIMRIISYSITRSDQISTEISSAFKNAIFFPKQEELYMIPLSQYGFHADWSYYVCVLSCYENDCPVSTDQLTKISTFIENHISYKQFSRYAVFPYENQLLILMGNYSSEDMDKMTDCIKNFLNNLFSTTNKTYYLGVGKPTHSIRCIYKSYKQANSIQKLQKQQRICSDCFSYKDMGIYKLLLEIDNIEILEDYYNATLAPLVAFDENNNSDLTQVLKCYLNNNGSIKETADDLFLHRNSINYKIKKAETILNLDLSQLNNRVQLIVSFIIMDLL